MMHMSGCTHLFGKVMKVSHLTNTCSRGQTLRNFGVTRCAETITPKPLRVRPG